VIEINDLSKSYRRGWSRRKVSAVKKVNLRVSPASIVAFVGPNGAGKTTTIQTVLGFLTPDAGTIRLFGKSTDTAVLQRIGYQPEIFHTYPFYKAHEVLRYYGRLSGMSPQDLDQAVPRTLERMGYHGRIESRDLLQGYDATLVGLSGPPPRSGASFLMSPPADWILRGGGLCRLSSRRESQGSNNLYSHILSDVERTCDEVFKIRQARLCIRALTIRARASSGDRSSAWKKAVKEQLTDFR
jgi:ABC-2 type transport system ATP-binding protein